MGSVTREYSVMNSADRRWSGPSNHLDTTKFPDFDPSIGVREYLTIQEEQEEEEERKGWERDGKSLANASNRSRPNGVLHSERWAPRKDFHHAWANGTATGGLRGHIRQKSLADAIRTISSRMGSVSANAQEIAEALKAPISVKLVVCI